MTSKFTELAIDCADPAGLARFWCAVLGYEVRDEDDETVTIGPPGGERRTGPVPPVLTFARVPEGKTVKNRVHIDVSPTDREQDDEVRRLLDRTAERRQTLLFSATLDGVVDALVQRYQHDPVFHELAERGGQPLPL